MGTPLDEIRRLLDGAALSARQVIEMHLARLREQAARQTRLAERLAALARHMDSTEGVGIDELCRIIEATNMENYFSPEQLAVLQERRARVGEQRMQEVRAAWGEILPAVRAKMDAGADPAGLDELRWLIEEWRVSVFAQEVKTAEPVSAKRLARALAALS